MRQCAVCQKGSIMAGTRKLLRGHYNPTNWSRKYPNLQKSRLASGERALVCTQCLKQLHKTTTNVSPSSPAAGGPAEAVKA